MIWPSVPGSPLVGRGWEESPGFVALHTVVEIVEGCLAQSFGDYRGLKMCTVNVGSLKGRSREVVEMLSRRGVDICCPQELQYWGGGTTSVGANEDNEDACGIVS